MAQQIHRVSKKRSNLSKVIKPSFFWKTLYLANKHRKRQLQKVFNKWMHKLLVYLFHSRKDRFSLSQNLNWRSSTLQKSFYYICLKKCIRDNAFKESYLQNIFLFTYHVEQHELSEVPCHCLSCGLMNRLSSDSWSYRHSVFQWFFRSQPVLEIPK